MARIRLGLGSLSRRLLLAMVALVGASLLLVDIGAVYFLHNVLETNLEVQLQTSAETEAHFYLRTGAVRDRRALGEDLAIYDANGERVATVGATPTAAPPPGLTRAGRELRDVLIVPGGYFLEQVSTNAVSGPVGILEEVLALVTLAAVLLAAVVAVGIARGLTSPLSELSAEAARISETGDLETHLPKDHGVREIRSLAEALQHMLKRLSQMFGALEASEQRERALREMTLHDLRTPLSTVLGTLELLASGRLRQDEAREAAGLAQREAARLALRIRDLDTQEGEPLSDLSRIVPQLSRGYEMTAGPADTWVTAPAAEVRQVLELLLDNAERHNPPGTEITLGWRREGGQAMAWVEDKGVGMTAEVKEHAFERFFRGDRLGGLGLGLSLARVLVESRGGSVELETEPGKGTGVRVRWPLGTAPEEGN